MFREGIFQRNDLNQRIYSLGLGVRVWVRDILEKDCKNNIVSKREEKLNKANLTFLYYGC